MNESDICSDDRGDRALDRNKIPRSRRVQITNRRTIAAAIATAGYADDLAEIRREVTKRHDEAVKRLQDSIAHPKQEMPRESLYGADEIFLTGTASEVTPVRSLDRIRIGGGKRGPVTEKVQKRYLDIARGAAPDSHHWLTHVRDEKR